MMHNLHELEELFCKFPGIGPKQAKRFVYFLISSNDYYRQQLVQKISALKQDINICQNCFHIFVKDYADNLICPICRDQNRQSNTLLLVARDIDLEHLEKMNVYHGLYFVLGGTIPILDQEPSKKIRLSALLHYLQQHQNVSEIIFALNTTPEGEHTAKFILNQLKPYADKIKFSHLGRGLSTGSELEYTDKETIKNALEHRV